MLLGGHDKGTELNEFAQKVSATCAYASALERQVLALQRRFAAFLAAMQKW